jgi:Fic family protein
MSPGFHPQTLRTVNPPFDSKLTRTILELQYLRKQGATLTAEPRIFFQLKELFHLLESIGSARIEGNRTTIAEAVEARIDKTPAANEGLKEILNIEQAMEFIEENIQCGSIINSGFVLELHRRVVGNLTREGDRTPGQYRKGNITITNSTHVAPDGIILNDYLEEFFAFINQEADPLHDLLRIALAHHRFTWIHPFNNGNGRVVRLLTYALLIAKGFDVGSSRMLNPSAVFCSNRDLYYQKLSIADQGTDDALLEWCDYVLSGLLREIHRVDQLADSGFLIATILRPAVRYALERRLVTELESHILEIAIKQGTFKAADIEFLTEGKLPSERSRILARMKENRLIEPIEDKGRRYTIRFSGSPLLRCLVHALRAAGFIDED